MNPPPREGQRFSFIPTLTLVFTIAAMALDLPQLPRFLGKVGGDFDMRRNEVWCVLAGVDPFDVWSGKVVSDEFHGVHRPNPRRAIRQLHAYAPWEYTFIAPVALWPRRMASLVFHALSLLSAAFLMVTGFRAGHAVRGRFADGAFVAMATMMTGTGVNATMDTQNFGLVLPAFLVAMVLLLEHGHDILAGVFWALAMIKPQMAALFVFPLVFRGKWKTILVAAGICCAATLPPAVLTETSPITLVLHLSKIGTEFVSSTGFLPKPFFSCLVERFTLTGAVIAGAAFGALLCACFSWKVRKAEHWLIAVAPSAICSLAWTYKMPYDYCILSLPLLVISLWIVSRERELKSKEGISHNLRAKLESVGVLALALVPFLSYLQPETTIGRALWTFLHVPVGESLSTTISLFRQFSEMTAFLGLCVWFAAHTAEKKRFP